MMPPAKRYYLTYFVAELQNPIIKEIIKQVNEIDIEKHKKAYDNLFNSNKWNNGNVIRLEIIYNIYNFCVIIIYYSFKYSVIF